MQFWHFFLSHFIFLRIYYCPFSLLCCAHTHQIYGSRAMHFVCVCFVHCTSIVFTFAAGAFSNVYKCIRVKRTMALYTTHEHTRTHNYKLNDKSLDKNYGIIFGTRMSELNYVCVYLLVLLSIYADAVCASAKVTRRIVFILFFFCREWRGYTRCMSNVQFLFREWVVRLSGASATIISSHVRIVVQLGELYILQFLI